MFSRGMSRGDAYFHMLLAGCVIGGTLFAQSAGSALWQSHNRGVCSHANSPHACFISQSAYKFDCTLGAW